MMKIEPEIILPYEDLPESNNELIKSLKIIQNTVKYYGFDNYSTCRRLILRRDSLKHSMELLEESIQRKQRNLEMFLNLNLLTEWIHAQIRMIEYNQTTLNILIRTLADCYTDYGNHIMNEHLNDED